jgi:hypothetical protein
LIEEGMVSPELEGKLGASALPLHLVVAAVKNR